MAKRMKNTNAAKSRSKAVTLLVTVDVLLARRAMCRQQLPKGGVHKNKACKPRVAQRAALRREAGNG